VKVKISAAIIFVTGSLYGQDYRPGFIIKANGDSLTGFIENGTVKKNSKVCFFKAQRGKAREAFTPDELSAYGILDYKYYDSKTISVEGGEKKKAFVEVLVKGRVSLYRYIDEFYLEKDSIFLLPRAKGREIETDNGRFTITDKKYVGLLNYFFKDCDLKADKTSYNEKALIYLVQNYNRCKGAAGTVHKTSRAWTHVTANVFFVYDNSSVKLTGFENYSIAPSTSMAFGGGIAVSAPKITDKTFVCLELWYIKKIFQGYSESSYNNSVTRSDLYIHPDFLKIPIGIKYNFLQESNTPFVKAGFSQYFLTSVSAKVMEDKETSGLVVTTDYQLTLDKRNQTGVWIGAGYIRQLNHLASLFTEVRYEMNNGFVEDNLISHSSGTSFNILFGLRF